jgi:hypothetical protein
LFTAWVAFPLVLGLLAFGCGALVERAADRTLPLSVRLPTGVALVIGVLDLFTRSTSTVDAAIPAVCALAAGGLVFRPPWRWRPRDRALIAPAVVFAVYAAPIVLSGSATWAGYVKLDDTATWLALVDRTLSAGHTLAGLPTSTYTDALAAYLTNGYPVGSFLPLGLGHAFLGADIAWLTDPWMAFAGAMLALSLYRIADRALGSGAPRWQAPAIAAVAAQPALLYGYYLWGGMKEMCGAMLVAAFASTAPLVWEAQDGEPREGPREASSRSETGRARSAGSRRETGRTRRFGAQRTARERGSSGGAVDRAAAVRRARAAIPALVVVWGVLSVLSGGGLVWLVPGGALALVVLSQRNGLRLPATRLLVRGAAAVAVVGGLAAYLALRPGGFVATNESVLTGGKELGNLLAPLHLRQIAGIWLSGDFRTMPSSSFVTDLLIVVAIVAAAAGLVMAIRRDRRELTLYVLCAVTGALIVFVVASPWLAGKALASASPAMVIAALVGCATALPNRASRDGTRPEETSAPSQPVRGGVAARVPWRPLGTLGGVTIVAAVAMVAGLAIVAGVVWSNALGYHDAALAPRAQLAELQEIGEAIAGEGPTLMTDYSPYGGRHFLREAEAESASELRSRTDPLLSGRPLAKATTADIDQFQTGPLLVYRTLVLRRSPVASRPPSPYTLRLRDRYWEVWQRPAQASPTVLSHLPLGDSVEPGGVPSCAAIQRLAGTPGAAKLVAAPATNPLVVGAGEGAHPPGWSHGREYLVLKGKGTATLRVTVPQAGRHELWLGGSISGPVKLTVNGTEIDTARYELQEDGQYVPFGSIGLERGKYEIAISYNGGDLRPGSGGPAATVGPLILKREAPEAKLLDVALGNARTLCGHTLDWVEAVGR